MSIRRLPFLALLVVCLLAMLPLQAQAAGIVKWYRAGSGLELGAGNGVTEVTEGGQEEPMVYAIVDGGGLFSSADMGKTWTALKGNGEPLAHPYTVTASPVDGKTVYVASATAGQGLWISTDAGKTFTQLATAKTGLASDDIESITVSAKFPDMILVGHRAGMKMSVSTDKGKTFKAVAVSDKEEIKNALGFIVDTTHWAVCSRSGPDDQGSSVFYTTEDAGDNWAHASGDVDHFGGHLPVIQSGDLFMSTRHHGPSKSEDGGKTWKWAMADHTRVVGAAGEILFWEGGRPFIRGTQDRILNIEMSDNLGQAWTSANTNLLQVIPQALRSSVTIPAQLDPYAHMRLVTAFAASVDNKNVFLSLGKAGLYRGQLLWTKDGPRLAGQTVTPASVPEKDNATEIVINVSASGKKGPVKRVYADLSALGMGELDLFDDGKHHDGAEGDKVFGNAFAVKGVVAPGPKVIGLVAEDDKGNFSSAAQTFEIASQAEAFVLWNGEKFAAGQSWLAPQSALNSFKAQTDEAHSGKVALELHGEGSGYIGGGWNWRGWYPAGSGDDFRKFRNFSFWVKYDHVEGDNSNDVGISLISANEGATGVANVSSYVPDFKDGKWHECNIPLVDMYNSKTDTKAGGAAFDPSHVWMVNISSWTPKTHSFSLFIDDIAINNLPVRPHSVWTSVADPRQSATMPADAPAVTASVTTKSEGLTISPYIYGAAMADHKVAQEIGLTILRAGGNPVTAVNWKDGYSSQGSDWFYENAGTKTPPENNWIVSFFGKNKPAGFESYVSIPMMGRVAKDGTSPGFDTTKYKDQTDWAGKAQPTDRMPNAGSGIAYTRDDKGEIVKGADGKPVTHPVIADPNDSSVVMTPEEQTDMLRYMVDKMGYGTADKGGLKYMALDNEPGLWNVTHRAMHPDGMSYDELWDKTRTFATLLKKIDPAIKIAGPTAWGWTEYLCSGKDQQMISESNGKLTWDHPPDQEAHGGVPLSKWYLQQIAKYKKDTGVQLVDIFDWHFYPQTGIYMAGARNDPKVMEGRVQETRVLWDPTWVDPTWMGNEATPKHVIQLLHMMKNWIHETGNDGMQTSIGEYCFGGEGDISGGVAQAEILGIFAREKLDFAFYWFAPAANSSTYFAYKMYRNPDGNHTAFGDHYLPSTCSAPDDVSVHAAKDSKTGRLTFVLVNKRMAKAAKVTINLDAPMKEQDLTRYEYSQADINCIGQLPTTKVSGQSLMIDLAPMSVQRFDLVP